MPFWSAEEARTFLTSVRDDLLYPAFALALTTGLRRGELLGIAERDLDLDGARLHIRQTIVTINFQVEFSTPTTAAGLRVVAPGTETVAVLKRHRLAQAEARLAIGVYEDHGLVFASPLGTPIDPSHLRRVWARIATKAQLPHLKFHDCRHVCATLMLQSGVNPKIVSERLGHSSVSITLDVYSSVLPTLQAGAAEAVEQLVAMGER